jgi:hypothetical protein
MNENPRKSTVTLEDLLRLKRAEQPPAEFWAQFERGMRTKQLAAIVEPRPWWASFIRVGARVSRYQLPVGAAAILALTFVTLSEYRTVEVAPVYEPAVASIVAPEAREVSAVIPADTADATSLPAAVPVAMVATPAPAAAPTANPVEVNAQANAQLGASSHVVPVNVELTPSARYIAENFAAAQADDPELDQMLGRSMRGLESRQTRVEPLAQVNVPGESRRSRLMGGATWMASATVSGDSALRTDDHSSRRLTERRLSESDVVSRIDLVGDRVSVKF